MKPIIVSALTAALLLAAGASHAVDAARARELAKTACIGCHAAANRIVGPAYRDVAARYQGSEPARLAASIKAGGSGKWGAVAMPAQPRLSEADARLLAEWVLAGAPGL